ncbi:glycosyltransferase family 2 protein [Massilibacterium senegalense]|uniref:glycosyltransferase n=1 Tax=Massilibacterium senegalense TaxID=1632858 RepID=UPI000782DAB9|nr:glycosyltransferase family 2 protein [Massilibacterium senegalense]
MIDTVLLFLSIITALFWLVVAVGTTFSIRHIPTLPETTRTKYPSLSIIVAAKDEEKAIRESISSQLKQDYPNVEWVLVDDRSSDGTLSIMKQLAAKDERITVLSIEELPEGWLGKNHALYKGYKQASGELILFTDADVIFERTDVLKRSVAMLQTENVDHVTISPTLQAKSFMLQAFIGFFLFGFHYFKRPHRANDDRSSVAMGVGAFNLLRKEAYEAIGTHEQIRFRPDDDLQIGIQIKKNGLKQRFVTGIGDIRVEWYPSLKEAIIGLEKNMFAGLHFRYYMVFVAIFGVFISQTFPFLALLFTSGATFWFNVMSIVLMLFIYVQIINLFTPFSRWTTILFPVSSLLFIYTIIRAIGLMIYRGGIVWRRTTYSLQELKEWKKG